MSDASKYASQRVFDGKRLLSSESVAKLRASYERADAMSDDSACRRCNGWGHPPGDKNIPCYSCGATGIEPSRRADAMSDDKSARNINEIIDAMPPDRQAKIAARAEELRADAMSDDKTLDEFKEFLTDLADLNVDEPTRIALLAAREYIAEDNNPKSNRVLALIYAALKSSEG